MEADFIVARSVLHSIPTFSDNLNDQKGILLLIIWIGAVSSSGYHRLGRCRYTLHQLKYIYIHEGHPPQQIHIFLQMDQLPTSNSFTIKNFTLCPNCITINCPKIFRKSRTLYCQKVTCKTIREKISSQKYLTCQVG